MISWDVLTLSSTVACDGSECQSALRFVDEDGDPRELAEAAGWHVERDKMSRLYGRTYCPACKDGRPVIVEE